MEKTYKYDAFISYRHISPDKPVAEQLQKLLETYIPPKGIADKKAFKKLRLFRDETELPTSSSLGDDIRDALNDSRFLVVICSPDTEKSKWCMEEINYFKELHGGSGKNILAVIARTDGNGLFPDILRFDTVISEDELGNKTTSIHEVEPLGANVCSDTLKGSMKKLKTEFLRIAAPLLDCGYDDLYNRDLRRRNQTRMKIALVSAAALAVISIASIAALLTISAQKNQIEKDSLQLKKDQAVMLTQESKELNNSGNSYAAREAVVEAYAINKDTGQTINGITEQAAELGGVYRDRYFTAVKKLSHPSAVRSMCLLDSGKELATYDNNNVYLWDTQSGKLIKTFENVAAADIAFLKSESISSSDVELTLKGAITGTAKGSFVLYDGYRKVLRDEAFTTDTSVYMVGKDNHSVFELAANGTEKWTYTFDSDIMIGKIDSPVGSEGIIIDTNKGYTVLSPDDGNILFSINDDELSEDSTSSIFSETIYSNNRFIILYEKDSQMQLNMYGKENGSAKLMSTQTVDDLSSMLASSISMKSFGNLLLLSADADKDALFKLPYFKAFDLSTGKEVWSYTAEKIAGGRTFAGYLEKGGAADNGISIAFAIVGNHLFIVDADSSGLLYSQTLPENIIRMYYSENGYVFLADASGEEMVFPLRHIKSADDFTERTFFESNSFGMSFDIADYNSNLYAVAQNGQNDVYIYRTIESPADAALYSADNDESYISEFVLSPDKKLAAVRLSSPQKLIVIDTASDKVIAETALESYPDRILMGNDDITVAYSNKAVFYKAATLERLGEAEKGYSDKYMLSAENDEFIIRDREKGLLAYDSTAKVRTLIENKDDSMVVEEYYCAPKLERTLVRVRESSTDNGSFSSGYNLRIYDSEFKSFVEVGDFGDTDKELSSAAWSEDMSTVYFLGKSNSIIAADTSTGEIILEQSYPREISKLLYFGGRLCIIDNENDLICVDIENNELKETGRIKIGDKISASSVRFDMFSNGKAGILSSEKPSESGIMIDTDRFEIIYRIDNFCGFDEGSDQLYVVHSSSNIRAYKMLTPEDIIERIKAMV